MTAHRPLSISILVTLLVAACSAGAAGPTEPADVTSVPTGSATTIRLEVTLTDALRIEPATVTVPAGIPVTFVVTNSGALDHEFYLGDATAQAEHEVEMAEMGGMLHDEPEGIALKPGETKELTYTFAAPGETLAGCHVVGHYGGGMKATVTVTG